MKSYWVKMIRWECNALGTLRRDTGCGMQPREGFHRKILFHSFYQRVHWNRKYKKLCLIASFTPLKQHVFFLTVHLSNNHRIPKMTGHTYRIPFTLEPTVYLSICGYDAGGQRTRPHVTHLAACIVIDYEIEESSIVDYLIGRMITEGNVPLLTALLKHARWGRGGGLGGCEMTSGGWKLQTLKKENFFAISSSLTNWLNYSLLMAFLSNWQKRVTD